jgi:hypothetical protein
MDDEFSLDGKLESPSFLIQSPHVIRPPVLFFTFFFYSSWCDALLHVYKYLHAYIMVMVGRESGLNGGKQ